MCENNKIGTKRCGIGNFCRTFDNVYYRFKQN